MSYAVRKDGAGWRAVDGPGDCGDDELWQEDQPDVIDTDPVPAQNPVDKLKAFLAENPDVAALLKN